MTELPGFNVIGHLRAASGLGNTARLFIDVLKARGHPVAGMDVDDYDNPDLAVPLDGLEIVPADRLPFENSLVIVALGRLPHLWINSGAALLGDAHRIAGLVFWELQVIPRAWLPSLRLFDVALACSHWVRQALETAIPEVPTAYAEHPLPRQSPPMDRWETRAAFGIPLDAVAFCCSFDPRSGFARKNTDGTVKAWRAAFPSTSDACLVVKMNGAAGANDPEYLKLVAEVQRDPRIIVVQEQLAHERVMQLFACCDVFVSLHRSEGLGLVPMEAMSLGKLVIATGYSGNVTFMTEQNSLCVPYRLVEPAGDVPFFLPRFAGRNAVWAEPDLQAASDLMRRSAQDADLRRRLGERAASDIRSRQETAWAGHCFDQVAGLLARSTRPSLRPGLRRQVVLQEIVDPTLRSMNVSKVLGRWIPRR
jgi:glycosyltransferase involved in cell wall biosynthesis